VLNQIVDEIKNYFSSITAISSSSSTEIYRRCTATPLAGPLEWSDNGRHHWWQGPGAIYSNLNPVWIHYGTSSKQYMFWQPQRDSYLSRWLLFSSNSVLGINNLFDKFTFLDNQHLYVMQLKQKQHGKQHENRM
jgi:hypothetical protein